MTTRFDPCPCGRGVSYGVCCGPLHDGEPAQTAEALMRSRYSAYTLGLDDYILRTWHPRTRPEQVSPSPGVTRGMTWTGLEVLGAVGGEVGDETGTVEFRAYFRGPAGADSLHETSRFERRAGRWVYVDGDVD